jgi:hypothetical protein
MRTRRNAVIGLVLVGLLDLPGQVLGQVDSTSDPDQVISPVVVETTWGPCSGGERADGYVHVDCNVSADDARLSGQMSMVMSLEEAVTIDSSTGEGASTARYTGIARIVNDEGAWLGPADGVIYPDGTEVSYTWFTGEDAYEGLTFFSIYDGPADAVTRHEVDMIWAGPPPAVPDVSLLAD